MRPALCLSPQDVACRNAVPSGQLLMCGSMMLLGIRLSHNEMLAVVRTFAGSSNRDEVSKQTHKQEANPPPMRAQT